MLITIRKYKMGVTELVFELKALTQNKIILLVFYQSFCIIIFFVPMVFCYNMGSLNLLHFILWLLFQCAIKIVIKLPNEVLREIHSFIIQVHDFIDNYVTKLPSSQRSSGISKEFPKPLGQKFSETHCDTRDSMARFLHG